jgi:hypothetical protein
MSWKRLAWSVTFMTRYSTTPPTLLLLSAGGVRPRVDHELVVDPIHWQARPVGDQDVQGVSTRRGLV